MSVIGRTRSALFQQKWLCAAMLLAVLLGIACAAHAADKDALRPADTSSPRTTLEGFIETTDHLYRQLTDVLTDYASSGRLYLSPEQRRTQAGVFKDAPMAIRFLDLSDIPPVLRDTVSVERLIQLKEIFDRIDIPPFADIPDRETMARMSSKRWRLPGTEIDIVLIESGPRAGEYLFSAATVDRIPEFYDLVKDLPYKPGPGQKLADIYRSLTHSSSATIYDAFLTSPIGLSYVIPPRWMLSMPAWTKTRIAGVACWQ
jgi:MscS family membrane protein